MPQERDSDDLIEEALDHLEDAEERRAKARALRADADALDAKADQDGLKVERGLEKVKHDHRERDDNDDVKVRFRHLAEHEAARFEVDDDETLQAIWDRAYVELAVNRGERDVLQAPKPGGNPINLMEHLALSLEEARSRELCDRTFEIAARTGGA
jgi:hypothetical protein